MSFKENYAYGMRFVPLARFLVAPHILKVASFKEDTEFATDLILLKANGLSIGVRVRRPGADQKWPFDFTLRSKLDNGCKTEYAKILEGHMDLFFYAHGNDTNSQPKIGLWMLVDMDRWRDEVELVGESNLVRSGLCCNRTHGDGTHFKAFDVRRWPRDMIVAGTSNLMERAGSDYTDSTMYLRQGLLL